MSNVNYRELQRSKIFISKNIPIHCYRVSEPERNSFDLGDLKRI